MASEFSVSAFNGDNSADYGIPSQVTDAAKVDVLAEIASDLLAAMVNDGRMSRAEEREWRAQIDAVVLDRPELIEPGGTVIREAEDITFAASRD
ncbi:hypothetical protein amrb99_24810 [Actinomadura sp. RB99]|uniref:hypothetical protein n=1 Tax=Actinomadura sp. RB99 TaxID=2691577 RepID=UPI00168302C0|nr:hypothetical protein [Actinomadura sp. RB99]MBD2893559.1 hypothetical protein [Actinomadura sp. RB99]